MKVNKLKSRIIKATIFIYAFMSTQIVNISNNVVMAKYSNADISEVTDGFDILKDLALAVVGAIGVIFLAFGVVDFATSFSAHDTSQQMQGIKKATAGIIMVAVPIIIKLFV